MTHLSQKTLTQINHWLTKYPEKQRQSAVMAALTIVQTEHDGFLTTPLMDAVADYLGMPKIAVYEVATFYSMYNLKPVGRHKIDVCTNISCMLRGCDSVVKHLEKKLGVAMGDTTPDGRFTLKAVECLAACGGAPAMQIGHHYYENLTSESIDTILEGLE
jgi:NADH-quinone oxidoreductase subunit E